MNIEINPVRRTSVVSIKIDEVSIPLVEVRNVPMPEGTSKVAKITAKVLAGCTMLYGAYSIVSWIAPRVIHQSDRFGFHDQPDFDFDR